VPVAVDVEVCNRASLARAAAQYIRSIAIRFSMNQL